MRNLLVPFDGSNSARRALRHAIELAKAAAPTTVHVLYLYEEPIAYALGEVAVYFPRDELLAYEQQQSEAVLEAAAATLKEAGVPFSTEGRLGAIADGIVRRSEEVHCDGIVMGTHGRSAIGSLLMGSVAMRVVHLAKVPVTLVK